MRLRAVLLTVALVGGCASETDEPLFRGEAPPMPDDLDEIVADTRAALDDAGSVELVTRAAAGPQETVVEARWSPSGVGSMTVARSGYGDLLSSEAEIRSDGTVAWARSDALDFEDALPEGAHWIEASFAELAEVGVLDPLVTTRDALLFLRDLDDVEDGGVGEVDGDVVRLVRGRVDYAALLVAASLDERARMDAVLSSPLLAVRRFTAELALDDGGLLRRLDLRYGLTTGDGHEDPRVWVDRSFELEPHRDEIEAPTPPDAADVVPAGEVPAALIAVGEPGESPPVGDVGGDPTTTAAVDDPAGVLERAAPDPEPPPADTPPDAVETTTLIAGDGPPAEVGDTVHVHYVLVLADGTEVDSSWDRGAVFPFTIGDGSVIAGWDEGMVGARVGERRRLVIGADKAYADDGVGDIPPDAPLAFEIDVVAVIAG
jgi:peptidylprolyl isomerase